MTACTLSHDCWAEHSSWTAVNLVERKGCTARNRGNMLYTKCVEHCAKATCCMPERSLDDYIYFQMGWLTSAWALFTVLWSTSRATILLSGMIVTRRLRRPFLSSSFPVSSLSTTTLNSCNTENYNKVCHQSQAQKKNFMQSCVILVNNDNLLNLLCL